ncbi:MAG: cytochrome oxidase subunit III [Candidatus Omnitrophica bacterium CG1_02_46_14]|nr:MAG: cytochrome oxidase subunit III [Candidatus Omnitrophica bacterium CG1_02_46_14]
MTVSKHSSFLQHHFDDMHQQQEASTLGMWLFLITEILFFGGLFAGYTVYRTMYPQAFQAASNHMNVPLGAFNTLILISSSLTMVLAVHEAKLGNRRGLIRNLLLTILLGAGFLGIKYVEYHDKFVHHLVPGTHFSFPAFDGPGTQLFFSFYFAMTGLHAFHMVIGMIFLAIFIRQARRGRFSAEYNTPVDMIGLYWHFVDIVWIFLFPLLYLIERH